MGKYKYQLHTHTAPCSACARTTPAELCEALHKAGYQGAVLTNHFFHGNTGIERGEPNEWKRFVEAYERDYEACVERAKQYDLDILFGIEEGVGGALEILCYGLTPQVLYDNPKLRNCTLPEFAQTMRENGVVLIQAHPFREVFYIPEPKVLPLEYIDGIEVYNRGNATVQMDERAMDFARQHPHLLQTAGGDAHRPNEVGFGGIEVDARIKTPEELTECLKQRAYRLIVGNASEE